MLQTSKTRQGGNFTKQIWRSMSSMKIISALKTAGGRKSGKQGCSAILLDLKKSIIFLEKFGTTCAIRFRSEKVR